VAPELPGDAGATGGGGGGAQGGGGGASTGGGGGLDAGTPRWQQRVHGFTSTTADPGCTVTIDALRGNAVQATIVGPDDAQDTAFAELVDANRLPLTPEGRLRGRITLAAPVAVRGLVPVVFLGTQTGRAFLRAGFDDQGRLVVQSDAQTLGDTALTERFEVDGGFSAGDWVLELAWRTGRFREVRLNGALLANTALTGGAATPPGELDLGIARYDGDAGTAFTVTLSGWQLADDLGVTLGAVP
jgi:hypothetical protein